MDDSALIRQVLGDMLRSESDIDLVGFARDGEDAIRQVELLKPDVITMDVEMPRMTGLEALRTIMEKHPTPVVMCSTLTSENASITMQALEIGAVDFVCKPKNGALSALRTLHDDLLHKIRAATSAKLRLKVRKPTTSIRPVTTGDRVVVIASSTGGPRALSELWECLPKGLNVPILVVQHMPAGFTASLAQRLDRMGTVPCAEATEANRVTPGIAYLAPGGKHLRVASNGFLTLDTAPPIHGVRPAADYLFMSVAELYGARTVGVVLTGMGKDGAAGALAIKEAGGVAFGESEESCTIYGMPRAAKAIGATSAEFPIHDMAQAIVAAVSARVAHAV